MQLYYIYLFLCCFSCFLFVFFLFILGPIDDEEERNRLENIQFLEAMIRMRDMEFQFSDEFIPRREPVPESWFERLDRWWFSRWWPSVGLIGGLWAVFFMWINRRNV